MEYNEFQRITRKGNFVAWQDSIEKETTAIAYMSENGWFNVAINALRDGDMGKKDADGVYSRHWGGDEVYIDDKPRLATEGEIFLYLHKVGGLKNAGAVDAQGNPLPLVGNRCETNFKPQNLREEFSVYIEKQALHAVKALVDAFFTEINTIS